MEEKSDQVKLFGTWSSAYCTRIELALKLKGIPYEYVEEDLSNKSDHLIKHNPVHKKVPVLVHNGRSICESLVILEYIDEHWNNSPKLLPEDPHERAKVRFWANFFDHKYVPTCHNIMACIGKEQEKAIEEFQELVKVFEEGLQRDFPTKFPLLDGGKLGFLEIVVGTTACHYKVFNEVIAVAFDPEKNPIFSSWLTAIKDCPLMKETLPPHDKMVAKLKTILSKLKPDHVKC